MTHQDAYTAQALASLLDKSVQYISRTANLQGWQSRPRKGRGGGKEWLVSSMPEATQRAIQTAEERRSIETEAAHNANLPTVYINKPGEIPPPVVRGTMYRPTRSAFASAL